MALTLVLGNKNYSSWSLRPYLALAHHKVPFEEIVIPLYEGDFKQAILKHSPAGNAILLRSQQLFPFVVRMLHLGRRHVDHRLRRQAARGFFTVALAGIRS